MGYLGDRWRGVVSRSGLLENFIRAISLPASRREYLRKNNCNICHNQLTNSLWCEQLFLAVSCRPFV